MNTFTGSAEPQGGPANAQEVTTTPKSCPCESTATEASLVPQARELNNPEIVSFSLDTAQKFAVMFRNIELIGEETGDEALAFIGNDCALQVYEAIRNQAGQSAVNAAEALVIQSRPQSEFDAAFDAVKALFEAEMSPATILEFRNPKRGDAQ